MQAQKNDMLIANLLEKVVTCNKKNSEKIITITYNDITTSDEEGIVSVKHSLDKFKEFEVSLDYDEEGYINKVIIKEI